MGEQEAGMILLLVVMLFLLVFLPALRQLLDDVL